MLLPGRRRHLLCSWQAFRSAARAPCLSLQPLLCHTLAGGFLCGDLGTELWGLGPAAWGSSAHSAAATCPRWPSRPVRAPTCVLGGRSVPESQGFCSETDRSAGGPRRSMTCGDYRMAPCAAHAPLWLLLWRKQVLTAGRLHLPSVLVRVPRILQRERAPGVPHPSRAVQAASGRGCAEGHRNSLQGLRQGRTWGEQGGVRASVPLSLSWALWPSVRRSALIDDLRCFVKSLCWSWEASRPGHHGIQAWALRTPEHPQSRRDPCPHLSVT